MHWYRVIPSLEDQIALQCDLVSLEQWAKSWGMVFNASKCHMMHISHSSSLQKYMYQLCGVILLSVTTEKYLGIYLNHDLKYSHHIDQVTANAVITIAIRLRSDYDVSHAPASIQRDSTQAKNERLVFHRSRIVVVSQLNRTHIVILFTFVVVEYVVVSSYRSQIAVVM